MKRIRSLLVSLGFAAGILLFAFTLSAANVEVNPAGPGKVQVGSNTLSESNPSVDKNLPTGESWKTSYTPDTNRLDFKINNGQPNFLFPTLGITPKTGQNFWVTLDEKSGLTEIGLPYPNPDGLIIYFPDGSTLNIPEGVSVQIKYLADGTAQVFFTQIGKERSKVIRYFDANGKMTILHCGESINVAGFSALPDWRKKGPERGAASPPQI